jgi:hypothetical protein
LLALIVPRRNKLQLGTDTLKACGAFGRKILSRLRYNNTYVVVLRGHRKAAANIKVTIEQRQPIARIALPSSFAGVDYLLKSLKLSLAFAYVWPKGNGRRVKEKTKEVIRPRE